jgi:hypothetical protein
MEYAFQRLPIFGRSGTISFSICPATNDAMDEGKKAV